VVCSKKWGSLRLQDIYRHPGTWRLVGYCSNVVIYVYRCATCPLWHLSAWWRCRQEPHVLDIARLANGNKITWTLIHGKKVTNCFDINILPFTFLFHCSQVYDKSLNLFQNFVIHKFICHALRRCIQKFPDWPPGTWTANGTAICR